MIINAYVFSAASGAFTTWNPADKSSLIDLSNGDLTATRGGTSGSDRMARAVVSKSSGKWALPILITTSGGGSIDLGIATSAANLGSYVGSDANGYGYDKNDGKVYFNGVGSAYGSAYGSGDMLELLYDATVGELRFTLNGSIQNGGTPAVTALTGSWFPAVSLFRSAVPADEATIGGTLSTYAVTNGYSQWA